MQELRLLHKLVAIALTIVLLVGIGLLVVDLLHLIQDPEQYERVYGFGDDEAAWQHRSSVRYAVVSLLVIAFCLAGIFLAGWSLWSGRAIITKWLYLYLAALSAFMLYRLVIWWQGGFDH